MRWPRAAILNSDFSLHGANSSFIDTAAAYATPHSSRPQVSSSPTTGRRPEDHKLIIIAGRCGRLANRITLVAHFVACANEQGYGLLNPTFHSYDDWYRGI